LFNTAICFEVSTGLNNRTELALADRADTSNIQQPASTTTGLAYMWIVLIPRMVSIDQQYNGIFLKVDRADTKKQSALASSTVRAAYICTRLFSVTQNISIIEYKLIFHTY
jgi:hypothetical protein